MKKRKVTIEDSGFGHEEIELVMTINGVDRPEAIHILEQRHVCNQRNTEKNGLRSSCKCIEAEDEQFISADEIFR